MFVCRHIDRLRSLSFRYNPATQVSSSSNAPALPTWEVAGSNVGRSSDWPG